MSPVIDENIEPPIPAENIRCQPPHRGEAGEIGEDGFHLRTGRPLGDEAARGLGAAGIATGEHNPHPGAGEPERGMKTDAGAGAGDKGDPFRSQPIRPLARNAGAAPSS